MRKKALRLVVMVLILLCLSITSVRAEEDSGSREDAEDIIRQQMEALDFDSMDSIMGEVSQDNQFYEQNFAFQSFGDLLSQLVSGEVDLTFGQWMQEILNLLFKEIPLQGHLLLQVAALALAESASEKSGRALSGQQRWRNRIFCRIRCVGDHLVSQLCGGCGYRPIDDGENSAGGICAYACLSSGGGRFRTSRLSHSSE